MSGARTNTFFIHCLGRISLIKPNMSDMEERTLKVSCIIQNFSPRHLQMLSQSKIAINYFIFALIATTVNICTQDVVVRAYSGRFHILTAVIFGTAAGLAAKYYLDKKYIFRFKARSAAHDTRIFMLYTAMGLATTVIFWGFEFGFHHLFQTREMRYLGGATGLAIGYLVKYQLDKRYVFRTEAA